MRRVSNLPQMMMSGFPDTVCFNGCAITMRTYCHGQLQCFQNNLDGSAIAQEHSIANSRRRCHTMVPPDVAEARCASRSAATAAEKKKCRKEERALTRKWRAELILRRGPKAKATLKMDKLECEGVATVDRAKWKTEVEKHCRKKYEDESRIVFDAMAEIDVLRSLQETSGRSPRRFFLRTGAGQS